MTLWGISIPSHRQLHGRGAIPRRGMDQAPDLLRNHKSQNLIVQDAWRTKTFMTYLSFIPSIEQEGTDCGTLWLGPKSPISRSERKKKTEHEPLRHR